VNRGDVYRTKFRLPDRKVPGQFTERNKYLVMLRGVTAETDVPFVVASTHDPARAPRPFEVIVSTTEGFDHQTVIDCRWPYTLPKAWFNTAEYRFTLSPDVMREVSVALVVGLQMRLR
jgi:hypothetical protein